MNRLHKVLFKRVSLPPLDKKLSIPSYQSLIEPPNNKVSNRFTLIRSAQRKTKIRGG